MEEEYTTAGANKKKSQLMYYLFIQPKKNK
jgi:hypothetical protein